MMLEIDFYRHAHTIWNGPPKRFQGRADVELSNKGIEQAILAGKKIDLGKYDLLFSSPAKRCQETLEHIYSSSGVVLPRVTVLPELWEIDNGNWSGLTVEEAKVQYPDELEVWFNNPASLASAGGGESLLGLQSRALYGLDLIRREAIEQYGKDDSIDAINVMVVTHGGVIRSLKSYFSKVSLNSFHQLHVSNLGKYTVSI